MFRSLFAVLEDGAEVDNIIDNSDQNGRIEELEGQVAQSEMIDAEQAIDIVNETIDNIIVNTNELDDIAKVTENSIEKNKGLTEDAGVMAEMAVEAICTRLGYKPVKKIVPAMESFGGTSSRLDATKYALEGIKELGSTIWEHIAKFFEMLWSKFKEFWDNLFIASEKEAARAKKLGYKIRDYEDNSYVTVIKDKLIKLKPYLMAFNAPTQDLLISNINDILNEHIDIIKMQHDMNSNFITQLSKVTRAEEINDKDMEPAKMHNEDHIVKLAFGREFTIKDGIMHLDQNRNTVYDYEDTAADINILKEVLSTAIILIDKVIGIKKITSEATFVIKRAAALANELAKKDETNEVNQVKKKIFNDTKNNMILINKSLPSLSLRAASVALDYISANLACYR
jgi:hypothetical protein